MEVKDLGRRLHNKNEVGNLDAVLLQIIWHGYLVA